MYLIKASEFAPGFANYKKGALDSQPQVISFTMVDGSLRVLRLIPPLKTGRHDIAEILLKVALSTINQIKSYKGYILFTWYIYIEEFEENKGVIISRKSK
jgi:hypothetical protein